MLALDDKRKCPFKLFHYHLDKVGKSQRLCPFLRIIKELCELGDTLGIGVRLEDMAVFLQKGTPNLIVGDNTVVNN